MDKRQIDSSHFGPADIRLHASIDERLDLSPWSETESGGILKVHCGEVTRLNSAGIQKWTVFFNGLRKKGVQLRFFELSPPMVEHTSVLITFIPRAEIESIQIPYFCAGCSEETRMLRKVSDLPESGLPLESMKCRLCGGPTEFDDDPEHYFAFLRNPQ